MIIVIHHYPHFLLCTKLNVAIQFNNWFSHWVYMFSSHAIFFFYDFGNPCPFNGIPVIVNAYPKLFNQMHYVITGDKVCHAEQYTPVQRVQ